MNCSFLKMYSSEQYVPRMNAMSNVVIYDDNINTKQCLSKPAVWKLGSGNVCPQISLREI